MQLKNLEKLVKRTGTAELIYTTDCLWIDNGYVKAPLFTFRELSEEQFYSVFNIPEKKQNDFHLTRRAAVAGEEALLCDAYDGEEAIRWNDGFTITYGGVEAAPMVSERGVLYADMRDLEVFFKENTHVGLYARWPEAEAFPVIAVKSGMFLKGLIAPIESHVVHPRFCNMIEQLGKMTRDVLKAGYVKPEGGGND